MSEEYLEYLEYPALSVDFIYASISLASSDAHLLREEKQLLSIYLLNFNFP